MFDKIRSPDHVCPVYAEFRGLDFFLKLNALRVVTFALSSIYFPTRPKKPFAFCVFGTWALGII
jgi:hypothetical protein